ncbi:hypothetical protein ACIGFK_17170 [Streptomyces sp. NPDC085524]|uniref:hypothetical protein n=1 Tax=unclassified Streptomyces TaxID=2593676 RepID=UPI0035DD36A0
MPDPYDHDPLRSLFREAAAAGRSRASLPPVSAIAVRGEKARRRRIAGFALACCLVLGASGAAVAAFLPRDAGPGLPATTPPPLAPSPAPNQSPPPTTGTTTAPTRTAYPPASNTSPASPPPTSTVSSTPTSTATSTPFPP